MRGFTLRKKIVAVLACIAAVGCVFAAVALANTTLSSHTGEVGATWTKHSAAGSNAEIITSTGRLRSVTINNSAIYYASGSPTNANYKVEADVYVASQPGSSAAGVTGRVDTSADTYYHCRFSSSGGGWQLFKFVSGTATQLGSTSAATLTNGNTYHLELNMNGTTIACKVDGSTVVTTTDSAISSAGKAGIRMHQAGGVTPSDGTGFQLDNVTATDL